MMEAAAAVTAIVKLIVAVKTVAIVTIRTQDQQKGHQTELTIAMQWRVPPIGHNNNSSEHLRMFLIHHSSKAQSVDDERSKPSVL